jgi:predicted DNA-binding protein
MPTSVRLDPETETLLKRLAQRSGRSKSDVLRDALHCLARESAGIAESDSVYAVVSDLVGRASGGPENLAREHKKAYRDALGRKHRR